MQESTNAGEQQFEKLTAGLYMGDIARRIILRCCLLIPSSARRSPEHEACGVVFSCDLALLRLKLICLTHVAQLASLCKPENG